jgi:arylsulfatase A-like enzyme
VSVPQLPGEAPHIVVIVADDLGYGDLSCLGSDFATPNLDRLAASGIRFTDWYSTSPVCSPSRASLLTGLYPQRTGVTDVLPSLRGAVPGLRPGIPTLSGALRDLGYRTGMVGKWHLGTAPQSWPDKHGFGDWFGFLGGCVDYYSHLYYYDDRTNPVHDLWENGREIFRNGRYLTELFTEQAVRRIRDWTAAADAPFFLYLAYNAPHYPMHAPSEYVDRFRHLAADRRITAAMVSALDDGVGVVLDELARRGVLDNTIVFFMLDNGPSPESRNWFDGQRVPWKGGSTAGLRGQKFTLFEGGVRVPAMRLCQGDSAGIPLGYSVCCYRFVAGGLAATRKPWFAFPESGGLLVRAATR